VLGTQVLHVYCRLCCLIGTFAWWMFNRKTCPTQVSSSGPMQDVLTLTLYQDGIYVSSELWGYWHETFPSHSICDMWAFMKNDIDDERAEFTRSLAWRGSRPPA
jgi:hypothetical protein